MVLAQNEKEFLDGLIEEASSLESPLLFILHRLQDEFRIIRKEHAEYVAKALNRPLSEIYGVATFYDRFSSEEKGLYTIKVCRGIVCHSKSSEELLEAISSYLGIKEDETTEDGTFTLEGSSCIGQCDGAPAMIINGKVHRDLTMSSAIKIIEDLKKGGE